MKMEIDLEKDDLVHVAKVIEFWTGFRNKNFTVTSQRTLTKSDNVCSKCGLAVDQKVVNFCKVRFNGKILFRDCQEVSQ